MNLDTPTLGEIAQIVGPSAAAVAAIASLYSVRLSRRIARETVAPDLSIQPTRDVHSCVGVIIHNAGTGAARGTHFHIIYGKHEIFDYVVHGIIRPGEMFEIVSDVPVKGGTEAAMLVSCRDREGRVHSWTQHEEHFVAKGRGRNKPKYGLAADRFREIYPKVGMSHLIRGEAQVRGPL